MSTQDIEREITPQMRIEQLEAMLAIVIGRHDGSYGFSPLELATRFMAPRKIVVKVRPTDGMFIATAVE